MRIGGPAICLAGGGRWRGSALPLYLKVKILQQKGLSCNGGGGGGKREVLHKFYLLSILLFQTVYKGLVTFSVKKWRSEEWNDRRKAGRKRREKRKETRK